VNRERPNRDARNAKPRAKFTANAERSECLQFV
jgi:hypothetical protein